MEVLPSSSVETEAQTPSTASSAAETAPAENPQDESIAEDHPSNKLTKEQATEIAMSLLVQGRRHLLVGDIPSAIAALAESSQILVEHYGEFAVECAESHYYYGMALLEMARLDPDVLGDAVEGGDKADDDSDDGEDDDEDEDEEEDSEEEQSENSEAKTNGEAEPESVEMKDVSEDTAASKKDEVATAGKTEEGVEGSSKIEKPEINGDEPKSKESKGKSLKIVDSLEPKAAKDTEEDTEEVSNLQLAWEVLEICKKIYTREVETNPSFKPQLADTMIRLAEVAIESENYSSAIEDLKNCLELQTAAFSSDSRSLAETRYQLGVAYTFTSEFREAIDNFEAAISIIETRIANLKNPSENKPSMEEPKNIFYTVEGEIEELESLLPDIKEKIADTIESEKEAARKSAENGTNDEGTSSNSNATTSEAAGSSSGLNESNSSKPALDITHLIRKKRKTDETESESPAKKVCAEAEAV